MPSQELILFCHGRLTKEMTDLKDWLDRHSVVSLEGLESGDSFTAKAVNSQNMRQAAERIKDCQKALSRITNGTFGICIVCGTEIDPERLMVLPYASRCRPCQEKKGVRIY